MSDEYLEALIGKRCRVMLYDKGSYRSRQCENKIKGRLEDGTPACGVHIGAQRRRILNKENRRKASEHRRQLSDRAHEVVGNIENLYPDLKPEVVFVWSHGSQPSRANPDAVRVDSKVLLELLERLDEENHDA